MADEQTETTGETPSPEGDGGAEPSAQTLSAEELDQQWRHRVSQKDKAHAAEAKALRDQLAAFEQQEATRRRAEEEARKASMTEAQRFEAERTELQRQLEQERQRTTVEIRKVKYPAIAADLDDQALAVMDEAKLAGLNARLTASGGSVEPPSLIDPNSAGRPQAPTAPAEQTSDQIKAQLASLGPAFAKELSGQ